MCAWFRHHVGRKHGIPARNRRGWPPPRWRTSQGQTRHGGQWGPRAPPRPGTNGCGTRTRSPTPWGARPSPWCWRCMGGPPPPPRAHLQHRPRFGGPSPPPAPPAPPPPSPRTRRLPARPRPRGAGAAGGAGADGDEEEWKEKKEGRAQCRMVAQQEKVEDTSAGYDETWCRQMVLICLKYLPASLK